MTKTKNTFKVNINSEDIIIAGGTRRVFLNYHNRLQRISSQTFRIPYTRAT